MWLNKLTQLLRRRPASGRESKAEAQGRRRLRPTLETLEDRFVPSTGTNVTTTLAPPMAATVLSGADTAGVQRELAQARQATEQYHDLDAALADGFVNTGLPCIEGQGFHYINPSRIGTVEVESPQLLMYNTSNQLVALEWFIPASLAGGTAPTLFGQTFHESADGSFYFLHVWAWRANPDGMFADANPRVHCDDAASHGGSVAGGSAAADVWASILDAVACESPGKRRW